jgi:hypothetical protein
MSVDLAEHFGELAAQVPVTPNESFDFTAELLPVSPELIETNRIVIKKSKYRYGGYYQVDLLWFYAEPETYRHLALLLLSCMFHAEPKPIRLHLTHPESEIKHVMLPYNYEEFDQNGLYVRPYRMSYTAGSFDLEHGWGFSIPELDRIAFRLTNLQDDVGWEEYESRDTIWLSGNERAYAWLAWHLLSIGRDDMEQNEYALEGSGQEGGVLGIWSAEVRFILHGYDSWQAKWKPAREGASPVGAQESSPTA